MSFSLQQIKRTRSDLPPRTLVYGTHKIGKSTFASCAPSPVFIQTEDGLDAIDADAFPLCQSWEDVLSCVGTLYNEPHEFKTVVLDSADWAEKLLHEHVVAEYKVKSIEQVEKGFGKGYVRAAEIFSELLDGLGALRTERGMGVVVLCHAEVRRFDDPMAESYDRYQLKLHKQVAKMLSEWSDVIGMAQLETMTTKHELGFNQERTRALTTGRRVLCLEGGPAFDAGNRLSLPRKIDLTWEAYQAALDNARGASSAAAPTK